MEKKSGAYEARRQLGRVLREVASKDDMYIVEKNGEAVAAVVPMHLYKQWKKDCEELFDMVREAAERANMAPEEADELALEAVRAVREEEARKATARSAR
ncbi:MAG: type II toxin-antitoxin system Phd/YefM family antitoxin [Chloroflexi bacterium]|nr:type II toxin-antitoxin system Phd/YefM family antitoxin [Chloroflexota bacterium]